MKLWQKYLLNNLEAADHVLNALLGGDTKTCLSTRLWVNHRDSWMRKAVDAVFGKNHCYQSALNESKDDSLIK